MMCDILLSQDINPDHINEENKYSTFQICSGVEKVISFHFEAETPHQAALNNLYEKF